MKNKQKGSAGLIALVVVILLLIGGALYFYQSKKVEAPVAQTQGVDQNQQAVSQNENTAVVPKDEVKVPVEDKTNNVAPTSSASTPTEIFTEFRKKFDAAKTFDEALAINLDYVTKNKVSEFKNQLTQVSAEMKAQLFPTIKLMIPPLSSVTIVSEKITGDTATLSLKNNSDSKLVGTVTLKKESGVWKIEGEAWK